MLDRDIRKILIPQLNQYFSKVIQEKQIWNKGTVVADVVGINQECMVGFEIKSDHDTFTRLENQIKTYSLVFDYNYLVTTDKYMNDGLKFIPKEWGLIWVHKGKLIEFRKAVKTPNQYNVVFSLFWREEIYNKMRADKVRGFRKAMIHLFPLVETTYKQEEMESYLRECLLKRTNWK